MSETLPEGQVYEKIVGLPLELRLYLENKMREPLSNKEIKRLFDEKFPWAAKAVTSKAVAGYRNKFVPEYKELLLQKYGKQAEQNPEQLEAEILKEVREAEADASLGDVDLSVEEKKKINMLAAHKKVLRELWQNYVSLKRTKEETAKARYLELAARELSLIGELEQSEKSFLSAMEEIRKAEQKMTIEQHYDSLTAWFIPRAMEKTKDKADAMAWLAKLGVYLGEYSQLISNSNTVGEANEALLTKFYVTKKVREEI